jgi:hypothetical protein
MENEELIEKIGRLLFTFILNQEYENILGATCSVETWIQHKENVDYLKDLFSDILKEENVTNEGKTVEEAIQLINYYESLNTYLNRSSGEKILVNGDESKIESLKKYIDKAAEKYN